MSMRKCVSSKDVAREAGVSQATVSYVLNDVKSVKIKPETRRIVLEAARKLNYYPNFIARGMKLKRSMSIGIVTERNVTSFYFMKTLEGIKDSIQRYNYSINLLFNKPGELSDTEFIRYYNSNRLDGIIFAFESADESILSYMKEKGIPFVVVDMNPTGSDVYEVCTDLLEHVSDVVSFFKSKGVSCIGYAGPEKKGGAEKRIERLISEANRQGLRIREEHIVHSVRDDSEIMKAITGLMASKEKPEAIVAGSPRFAPFTVKCALMSNIRIPEELRIISLGSSNFYTLTHPSISAVEVPLYDMGFHAADKLFEVMNGQITEKTTVLASELVIRDSS